MQDNSKLNGALTGLAVSAAAWWARYDDDTQRRLRNMREDTAECQEMIREMNSRGEVIRQRLPVVNDAQVGIALASQQPAQPAIVPSTAPASRPDLTSQMETAVADLKWPPEPGEYDGRGLVKVAGELTTTFLAITFEEVRAFIQGLAQAKPPSRDGKVQIFYAANSFTAVVSSLKLSYHGYHDAWLRLFGQPASAADSHASIASAPSVANYDPGVSSVLANGKPDIPAASDEHQNTDRSSKWKLTVGGANINSGASVVTFGFGTSFTLNGKPYKPTILCSDGRLVPFNVTPMGFSLKNIFALLANEVLEFSISVPFGDGPVNS